jgi:hypothetical protein
VIDVPGLGAGRHDLEIARDRRGERLPGGVYFYRVRAGEGVLTGRLLLLD